MKKFLIGIVLLVNLTVLNLNAAVTLNRNFTFGSAAAASSIPEAGLAIGFHKLIWTITGGTLSACQIKVQKSNDNITWTDLISAQTCTSAGQTTVTQAAAPFVRVNVTTLTILTGQPIINSNYLGMIDVTVDTMSGSGVNGQVTYFDGTETVTGDANFLYDRVNTKLTVPLVSAGNLDYSVQNYGAVCDGITNDTTNIQNAINAAGATGGVVSFPQGKSCKTTLTLTFSKSNVTVRGNNSEILFQPTVVAAGSDRAILVHLGDSNLSAPVDVTGAIAVGATSFVTSSTTGLLPGMWLFMYEKDPNAPPVEEIVISDYVQVRSVAGTTVNVYKPFRIAFTDGRSGTKYLRTTNLTQNVTIENLRVRTTDAVNPLPGFFVGIAQNTTLRDDISAPAIGNPFASYRSNGLTLINDTATTANGQNTEFAATTDLNIDGYKALSSNGIPNNVPIIVDFGSGFGHVKGSNLVSAGEFGLALWFGVYHFDLLDNIIGFVNDADGDNLTGCLSMIGVQDSTISNNHCVGGGGSNSTGIAVADTSGFVTNIPFVRNEITDNLISNFTNPYNAINCANVYRISNLGANGSSNIPCKIRMGQAVAASTPEDLIDIRSSTLTDLPIHWENPGISNWYVGPEYNDFSKVCADFNSKGANRFCITYDGHATVYAGLKVNTGATEIVNYLSTTASLDFAAWAGADCQDLDITLTGAANGDTVALGLNSSLATTAGVLFSAFIKTTDTITVRGCKITAGTSANPASASVRVSVFKH